MSFVYTNAKRALLAGELDLDAHDIRVMLVMTNTTADTEEDVSTISAFTTLDEFNGSGYARQALTGEAVTADNPGNFGKFDANDAAFGTLGAGARNIQAALVYRHITNDSDSIPIAFVDSGGFPFTANGSTFTIQWNSGGILQLT